MTVTLTSWISAVILLPSFVFVTTKSHQEHTHTHIFPWFYVWVWIWPTKATYNKSQETKVALKQKHTAQGFFPKPLCWVRTSAANTLRGFPSYLWFKSDHKHTFYSLSHKTRRPIKDNFHVSALLVLIYLNLLQRCKLPTLATEVYQAWW